MLHSACCIACCMLHSACCMLHSACCMSHAADFAMDCPRILYCLCCMLHVACCMLHVACGMLTNCEEKLRLSIDDRPIVTADRCGKILLRVDHDRCCNVL